MFRRLLIGCFWTIAAASGSDMAVAAERPNILFILVDDLGAHDLSGEGSAYYESPHVDRIADMGMRFSRGYAACQVCSPSRASILTAKYPVNHGITSWIGDRSGPAWRTHKRFDSHLPPDFGDRLRDSETTLAEVLLEAGYRTFFAGKWHLGSEGSSPEDHGFEINHGGWRAGSPHKGKYFSPYLNPKLEDGPKGESLPLRLGQETANFIANHKDEPFFAYLSFYSVHSPIQTTSSLWKKYRDKAHGSGSDEERFVFDRRLSVRQVQDCPIYAGMIESMDEAVGIVLAELERRRLLDTTIICFTSDNGGVSSGDAFATSNLPLRGGKGRQWEGGVRVPFYISVPGVTTPGTVSETLACGIDWYPTLLELIGVSFPEGQKLDGVSLVPALRGDAIPDRPLFWHYPHYGNQGGEPSSILLEKSWKLIYYHEDWRCELYDLSEDVGEQQDLASSEPERVESMLERLKSWLDSTHARFPTPDTDFAPEKREAYWQRLRTSGKAKLERQHARYLEAGYVPNPDWWGSSID